jgi:NAD(P)-dependent dehydrogenase (short-subunit alcohol dehydrogenase family)
MAGALVVGYGDPLGRITSARGGAMEQLVGRTAVITGGASGIGLATARLLAAEGMQLVLADIEKGPLDAAAHELGALGVRTDVGSLADVQALADAAFSYNGHVDVVFNNAGVAVGGPMVDMSHADWEWLMRVNLWGPIHGVEAFLPRMVARGSGGHLLFTASFAGLTPNVGLGPYCVTKYGVVAMAEVLQKELRDHDIGVSVLCPMRVATNIGSSERNRPEALGGPDVSPAVPDQAEDNRDLAGRVLPVEEVAADVVDAIKRNRLYIVPHAESRAFVRRRFERIDRAYEG